MPRAPAPLLLAPMLLAPMLLAALLGAQHEVHASPYKGRLYASEQQARLKCKGDEVVWVDPATGRFFRKGSGWYADTDTGAYACRNDIEPVAAPPPPRPADPLDPGRQP